MEKDDNDISVRAQGNWVPISKALLCELPINRPCTRLEAMFSLTVDYDTGAQVTQSGYAALWGWHRGKVDRFLKEIGVEVKYQENTGSKQNQRGQITSRYRADNRQIKFIDSKWLRNETDRKQTDNEQITSTTINPNPNPNPNPKAKANKNPSCPKPKKLVSDEAIRLSNLLADKIIKNNPQNRSVGNGKRDGTVQTWAADIDKIIRIDKQTPAVIEKVIRWSQSDDFWSGVIESGGSLRRNWDKLTAQMRPVSTQPAPTMPQKSSPFDGAVMGDK